MPIIIIFVVWLHGPALFSVLSCINLFNPQNSEVGTFIPVWPVRDLKQGCSLVQGQKAGNSKAGMNPGRLALELTLNHCAGVSSESAVQSGLSGS